MRSFARISVILIGIVALTGLVACGGSGDSSPPDPTASGNSQETAEQEDQPEVREVHTVDMVGDFDGYRYEPRELTIQHGDKVVWEMVSGAPHNVSFKNMEWPDGAEEVLKENGVFEGPELSAPGATYEIHFTEDYPTGRYEYLCVPHSTSDMIGYLTIESNEEG